MPRLADFARFFRDEKEDDEAALVENARSALEWCACRYHKHFLEWLDREASKPFNVSGSQLELLQQAVRSNTFREIRAYVGRIESEAVARVESARGNE